jgi:uncharacterized RDD family membrane protein YckC
VIEAVASYRKGETAGFASRVAAMFIDIVVISITFYAGLVLCTLTVQVLSFDRLDVTAVPEPAASAILAGWSVLYFWAGWWLFGKTVGKAILGLRVVRRDGGPVGWSRSLIRFGGYLLSLATFGLGFAWILIDRKRRDWADILARTSVVYDWHAHGAPLDAEAPDGATS